MSCPTTGLTAGTCRHSGRGTSLPRLQHVLVQANVKGAQRPYEQFSYLPFKTWGGYSFDLSPPYYSFYYTVSKLASIWMAVWV